MSFQAEYSKSYSNFPSLNGKIAMVVAHPDDEVLWGGGLLARLKGIDIYCCSIPRRDPERAFNFFKVAKYFGHNAFLLPFEETEPSSNLTNLELLDLSEYDVVITHNPEGEYGHIHHVDVHEHVKNNFSGDVYYFGYGDGDLILSLTDSELDGKKKALALYDNLSPFDNGKKKYEALLDRYDIKFDYEFYRKGAREDSEYLKNLSKLSDSKKSPNEIRELADYQKFTIKDGAITDINSRIDSKLKALQGFLPESFVGKSVLDIGCDFGFWSFHSAISGAKVVGLDRSRKVNGLGFVNLPMLNNFTALENGLDAQFYDFLAGKNWFNIGQYDTIFCMSVYHHIFQVCGSHEPIWYWLWQLTKGTLIWENPTDIDDVVVQMNVSEENKNSYNKKEILKASKKYFDIEKIGPALHEVTREVWLMKPKCASLNVLQGTYIKGAGGASHCFNYKDQRRIKEIKEILGVACLPGSFNLLLNEDSVFDWDNGFVVGQILDLVDRRTGLGGDWKPRQARFYPVELNGKSAWAFKFVGENYPDNFIEIISPEHLSQGLEHGDLVHLAQKVAI